MAKLRWACASILVATVVAAAGCGQLQGAQSLSGDGLDVLMQTVSVRQAEGITVETLPVGILRTGEPLLSVVLVEADEEVSTRSLAYFDGLAQRDGGGAELGVTGLCGQGWTKDGDQIQTERCGAATPATQIPAGRESLIHVVLHPVTPSGPVTTGTYRISIPLNDPDGPLLDLTYRVVKRGQAELPPWSAERIPLALSFENEPAEAWSSLLVRIEDGYGRLVDERELSVYKDDNADQENDGVFTVDVPRKLPLHIILLERDGNDWKPCGGGGVGFVTAKSKVPQTLLLGDCGVK